MARRNVVGSFPSLTMGRMMRFHSTIERDMLYWLDYASPVAHIKEQPFPIHYYKEGNKRKYRYTPDFFVQTTGGQQFLIECKPQSKVHSGDNQAKFTVAQQWCEENNMTFVLVTDAFLRTGYWLDNVKHLTLYSRYQEAEELLPTIAHALLDRSLSIEEAIELVNPDRPQAVYPLIMYLIFHHQLHIPLYDALISANTPLSLHPFSPPVWLPQLEQV